MGYNKYRIYSTAYPIAEVSPALGKFGLIEDSFWESKSLNARPGIKNRGYWIDASGSPEASFLLGGLIALFVERWAAILKARAGKAT